MIKKIYKIVLCILIVCSLTGCKMFDLNSFVLPDDNEFTTIIAELDTPEKICEYMENFEWNVSIHTYSPYQMYLANLEDWNDTGDCDDFATFGAWVAHQHGYEVYRMQIWVKFNSFYYLPLILPHVMGIYVEDDKYTYSNNQVYRPLFVESFQEIIDDYEDWNYSVISWKVYDYDNNLIETSE